MIIEAENGRPPGDAGPGDAGPGDAGPGDAGPGDAGPGDAGPGDADAGNVPPGETPPRAHPKDPLHGITLQMVLEDLQARYGWAELGRRIPIRCFTHEPSMGSSLAFLRRQPWARSQVEALYLRSRRRR